MKIKICGIKRSEDVGFANLFMPDYIGFILSKGYKRTVKIDDAKFLAAKADLKIKKVGVFVDMPAKNVASVADYTGIDIIQLHGENEDNDYINELRKYTDKEIWNVFKVKNEEEVLKAEKSIADMILLDTYSEKIAGGTGKKVDTDIILKSGLSRNFVLAGGIDNDNISDILSEIKPFCIDVSSGTETDGVKDPQKMADIIRKIRSEI
mgnify:FL=1